MFLLVYGNKISKIASLLYITQIEAGLFFKLRSKIYTFYFSFNFNKPENNCDFLSTYLILLKYKIFNL